MQWKLGVPVARETSQSGATPKLVLTVLLLCAPRLSHKLAYSERMCAAELAGILGVGLSELQVGVRHDS